MVFGSMLKSVTTSFEMVSKTNNFRINNEIENLIKMSKVDFEKQIFEKKFFLDLEIFSGCQTGGTLAENFSIFQKKNSKFYFSKSTFDIFIRF